MAQAPVSALTPSACPKCGTVLRDEQLPDGFSTVGFCDRCKGIWLDGGELARTYTAFEDFPDPAFSLTKARETRFPCVRCGQESTLVEMPYSPLSSIAVDYCRKCKGLYLDFQELAPVRALLRKAMENQDPAFEDPPGPVSFRHPLVDHWRLLLVIAILLYLGCCDLIPSWMPRPLGRPWQPITFEHDPEQVSDDLPQPFHKTIGGKDFLFEPVAKYRIEGRIVSRNRHYFNSPSPYSMDPDLSPVDLGISWGWLAKEQNRKAVSFFQFGRFLYAKSAPDVTFDEQSKVFSNNHIVPADGRMDSVTKSIRENDSVILEGFLVNITSSVGGRKWETSVSRDDDGPGACEIIYLTRARVNQFQY